MELKTKVGEDGGGGLEKVLEIKGKEGALWGRKKRKKYEGVGNRGG